MTYLGPKVIGNFKPSLGEKAKAKAKKPTEKRAQRAGNSDDHLAHIRRLPCLLCWIDENKIVGPSDPHHLKSGPAASERGAGMRATDKWAVPLCRQCHEDVEPTATVEQRRFKMSGIDEPWEVAAALWRVTGDRDRMTNILATHAMEARKKSAP
jgi:hypothetical protein